MAFCNQCGAPLNDGEQFCGKCGQSANAGGGSGGGGGNPFSNFSKDANEAGYIDPADIEKNKAMGGLAYFIFFLPLLACPESKYGRFHANQGLLYLFLCIAAGIVLSILSSVFLFIAWGLWIVVQILSFIVWIGILVIGIMGLINGFTGKVKELPLIGSIRIIK